MARLQRFRLRNFGDSQMTGKYGNLLKKARNTDEQQSVKPAIQESVNTENSSEAEIIKEKEVSLTIKVPISWRQHWVAECKREGKTLKEVVTEMLAEKYGLP